MSAEDFNEADVDKICTAILVACFVVGMVVGFVGGISKPEPEQTKIEQGADQ